MESRPAFRGADDVDLKADRIGCGSPMRDVFPRYCPFLLTGLAVTLCVIAIRPLSAADLPVVAARWDFGTEEVSALIGHGGVHRNQPGPRPPEFPDFDPQNTAVKFDGDGARLTLTDPGMESPFDFTNGDAMTLEAWIDVTQIGHGESRYIVGKGRTGAPGFSRDNQNWALRVREIDGRVHLNFLFATKSSGEAKPDSHWHRWTSKEGVTPGSGWHHVAVTYRFGEPNSIRGWLDGRPRDGVWDMGGATAEAPVVDNDAIWIASSQGGNPGSSFQGRLDGISVHRAVLTDEVLRARYRRIGPERIDPVIVESVPEIAEIPPGRVVVTFHEGLIAHQRWWNTSESLSAAVSRWDAPCFLIPRLPRRYDDWGIRDSWKPPVLVRAAADVILPAGPQRFIVRARGLSRLWINGAVVVRTKPHSGSSDGHEPVAPLPEPPLPGLREAGYGDQEAFGVAEVPADGHCRVILEAIVGGKNLRPEPGEMLVAVQSADGKSFELLKPAENSSAPLALTDADVSRAASLIESSLTELDDLTRRSAAKSQSGFWDRRHSQARDWAKRQSSAASFTLPSAESGSLPTRSAADRVNRDRDSSPEVSIDLFITNKLEMARNASAGDTGVAARHFHENVLPILRENCFRCHGEKAKGGLRLNTREATLKSGESGIVAVLPGEADKSHIIQRIRATDEGERMPPTGGGLTPGQITILENWIKAGAIWPAAPVSADELRLAPVLNDPDFLRRVTLDTLGLPPTEEEVRSFLADNSSDKRQRVIDRLLDDSRSADHWVSYWQDVLAENPNTLKPTLNNSGPFRWYLYESLRDNKAFDRLVTELILLRGSEREGGSAGFGMAADNDAPFAAKGHILASAFLGIDLQCARCHDSPYHSTKQRDLFSLSAMLSRKTVTVPPTSTVSPGFFDKNKDRESLIKVTLKPGEPVSPEWPFETLTAGLDEPSTAALMQKPGDSRELLAALMTAPQNERFPQVVVNRIWKRLLGAGIVEPVHDWEGRAASHPQLLAWLAREFVIHNYDTRHVVRLILNSQTYQRAGIGRNLAAEPETRFFAAPDRRRLTAEQVVDSLFASTGQRMEVEEITFDPEAKRGASSMISLGYPSRAWMFATLSNERDRPSLSLPRAQAVTDVLEAFGWTGSRQNPRTDREMEATASQPGILANGTVVSWVTRASMGSGLAQLAVGAQSPEQLVESIYLRMLGRLPSSAERATYGAELALGFGERLVPSSAIQTPTPLPKLGRVSWSNHLDSEANSIKLEMERRARAGAPPDPRLQSEWRERFEDFVWSMINSPEFVWLP